MVASAMPLPATAESASDAMRVRDAIEAHYDSLYRTALRFGVPPTDAEDLLQEVFFAFSRRTGDVPAETERAFLFGTMVRMVLMRRRTFVRRREEIVDSSSMEQLVGDTPTPEDDAERRDAIVVLDRVLSKMPDELRIVFTMCEIEEITMKEVGQILGVPAGTVGSRLFRARTMFETLAEREEKKERR
jgi:RNA polymerase sigma-70 factor (ECF subfamily)